MIRAVPDTNVLASGLIRRRPTSATVQIIDAWQAGSFRLVVSDYILDELARAFEQRYFRRRLSAQQIAELVHTIRTEATVVRLRTRMVGVAPHPEDDPILATAISGRASYLITGDRELLELGKYRRVSILSPWAFLERLRSQRG